MGCSQLVSLRSSSVRPLLDFSCSDMVLLSRHTQKHEDRLLAPLYAAPSRPLPTSVSRMPGRANLQPRTLGEVDAEELELYPLQWGPEDLYRAAICLD